jgi:hypothetical protein
VSWTVDLTASAQRDLRRLDRPVAPRILDALARLADTGQAMSPGCRAKLATRSLTSVGNEADLIRRRKPLAAHTISCPLRVSC